MYTLLPFFKIIKMPKIVSKGIINSAPTLPATRKQPLRHKTIVRSTSSTSKDSSEPPSEATAKRKAGTEEIVSSPNRQPLPTLHPKLGHLIFQDFPDFTPNLTPKQVIQAGSFGGTYFRNIKSGVTGLSYTTKQVLEDLPKDWFEGLTTKHYASQTYNDSINTYKASCGGDLNMWESSGWIRECDRKMTRMKSSSSSSSLSHPINPSIYKRTDGSSGTAGSTLVVDAVTTIVKLQGLLGSWAQKEDGATISSTRSFLHPPPPTLMLATTFPFHPKSDSCYNTGGTRLQRMISQLQPKNDKKNPPFYSKTTGVLNLSLVS